MNIISNVSFYIWRSYNGKFSERNCIILLNSLSGLKGQAIYTRVFKKS